MDGPGSGPGIPVAGFGKGLDRGEPRAAPQKGQVAVGILLLLGFATCFARLDATAKWINGSADPVRTARPSAQVARGLCIAAATLCWFFALRRLPLSQAKAITFAAPLITALLSRPVLGAWPGPHRLATAGVGFLGVLVVTRPWSGALLDPAMGLALHQRRPLQGSGLVHHSDRGSQDLALRYTERLVDAGVEPSVGSDGGSYDNALAETINGLYKAEVIHRRGPWRSFEAVAFATPEWVDWFNTRRLREPIGNIPPAEAEAADYAELEPTPRAA